MCTSTNAISSIPLMAIAYFLPTDVEYSDGRETVALMNDQRAYPLVASHIVRLVRSRPPRTAARERHRAGVWSRRPRSGHRRRVLAAHPRLPDDRAPRSAHMTEQVLRPGLTARIIYFVGAVALFSGSVIGLFYN